MSLLRYLTAGESHGPALARHHGRDAGRARAHGRAHPRGRPAPQARLRPRQPHEHRDRRGPDPRRRAARRRRSAARSRSIIDNRDHARGPRSCRPRTARSREAGARSTSRVPGTPIASAESSTALPTCATSSSARARAKLPHARRARGDRAQLSRVRSGSRFESRVVRIGEVVDESLARHRSRNAMSASTPRPCASSMPNADRSA